MEVLSEKEAFQKKTELGDNEKEKVPLGSGLELLYPALPAAHGPLGFLL